MYETSIWFSKSCKYLFGKGFSNSILKLRNLINEGRSRLEDHFGHFASSLLPVDIIVNMLCLRFNCDFKLRWL